MTSPEFSRMLSFACENTLLGIDYDPGVSWPFEINPKDARYEPMMRNIFDLTPQDIYLKGGFLFDELMLKDPVNWVKSMIHKTEEPVQ